MKGGCKKNNAMQRTQWGAEEVKCPFFRSHTYVEILCEGVTDDSTIRMLYRNRKGREKQERIFCADRYKNCEIYRAIMSAKYDD